MSATVPIFLLVGLGYLSTRAGMFGRDQMAVLSRYVVNLALPTLVFVSVHGRRVEEILNPTYLLTYALASLVMLALAVAYVAALRRPRVRTAFMYMGMSGTMNGFIGFPLFLIMLPEVAGIAVGMDMLVDNLMIVPLTLLIAEYAAGHAVSVGERVRTTLTQVALHPMVIAIIAALALNGLGVELPVALERSVTLLAQSSTAVALFAVGGFLTGLRLRGMRTDLVATVVGKLLVMPVVAIALVTALPLLGLPVLSPELRAAVVLTCALPTYSILPSVAEPYGEEDLGAAAMMVSVLGAFVTMTGWMIGLRLMGWL